MAAFTLLTFFESLEAMDAASVNIVKAAGGVLALSWFVRLLGRRAPPPFLLRAHPALSATACLFLCWAALSTLWAEQAGQAARDASRYGLVLALFVLVFAAVQAPRHARWILGAFVAGAVLTIFLGVFYDARQDVPTAFDASRLSGGILDPNTLAASLLPALAICAFGMWAVRGPMRWLLGSCAALFVGAILLTGSRGALVGLAVVVVGSLILGGPLRRTMLALALGLTAVAVGWYAFAAPAQMKERIADPGGGTGRLDLWMLGGRVVEDHPITGVGAGNFRVVEPRYFSETINLPNSEFYVDTPIVVHSTYLEVLTELGVVGFFLFAAIIVGSLVLTWRAAQEFSRIDPALELWTRGLLVGVLGLLTAFGFISAPYDKQMWLLLALGVALYSLSRSLATARDPG